MPRTARASVGNLCYHVLNRGNARQQVFFKDGDYEAFLNAMTHACVEARILASQMGLCTVDRPTSRAFWEPRRTNAA
jgi:putative transposase